MIHKLKQIALLCCFFLPSLSNAQDFYSAAQRSSWLSKAETSKPKLIEQEKKPVGLVKLTADPLAFQGWKAVPSGKIEDLYEKSFKGQSGVVVDFGEHLTGYYTFTIKASRNFPDAPLRFKLTFGEVPAELATPFDPYPGGLSRAWLQDETITVVDLPATITIPRRLAFRYLKIDLLGSSNGFDFKISDMKFKAESAVSLDTPPALPAATTDLIRQIDKVGLATLKECMQTVYEDGPKRDRRLWIGDLYLESLANSYSFKNHELTKRCLYILAGLAQKNGYLYASTFERPDLHAQEGQAFLFEYSLFFNAALKEYLIASGDKETALDLWAVARKQTENISRHLDANGLFDTRAAEKDGWWLFVDWREGLDKQASEQGIMIYAMRETLALAKQLGKENEVAELPALITKMTKAARVLYDKPSGLFISGAKRQVSYASQSWMILSEVASKAEAQKALKAILNDKNAVRPGTPYLTHYYVAALIKSGMTKEARQLLETYWGGMVAKGADTFWEAYDPDNDKLSPYNFFPINSYCHAWSCTPVYFIRKYPEIFQK